METVEKKHVYEESLNTKINLYKFVLGLSK